MKQAQVFSLICLLLTKKVDLLCQVVFYSSSTMVVMVMVNVHALSISLSPYLTLCQSYRRSKVQAARHATPAAADVLVGHRFRSVFIKVTPRATEQQVTVRALITPCAHSSSCSCSVCVSPATILSVSYQSSSLDTPSGFFSEVRKYTLYISIGVLFL